VSEIDKIHKQVLDNEFLIITSLNKTGKIEAIEKYYNLGAGGFATKGSRN
jgi:hypothetical protein